jgi:hypothetical protein
MIEGFFAILEVPANILQLLAGVSDIENAWYARRSRRGGAITLLPALPIPPVAARAPTRRK